MKKSVTYEGLIYKEDFLNDFKPPKTVWSNELQRNIESEHIYPENAVIDVGACVPCGRERLHVKVTVEVLREGL